MYKHVQSVPYVVRLYIHKKIYVVLHYNKRGKQIIMLNDSQIVTIL